MGHFTPEATYHAGSLKFAVRSAQGAIDFERMRSGFVIHDVVIFYFLSTKGGGATFVVFLILALSSKRDEQQIYKANVEIPNFIATFSGIFLRFNYSQSFTKYFSKNLFI
jgi:hypothetical protein